MGNFAHGKSRRRFCLTRMKKKINTVFAVLLTAFILMSTTSSSVLAYQVGDVGTYGDSSSPGGSLTGETDTDTSVGTGGSDISTDSTEAIMNQQSSRDLTEWFNEIPTQNQIGINSPNGFVIGENMTFSKEQIEELLSHSNYTDGEKYNSASQSATTDHAASDQEKDQLRSILQGTWNTGSTGSDTGTGSETGGGITGTSNTISENGDSALSVNGNNYYVDFNTISFATQWPTTGSSSSGIDINTFRDWLLAHGGKTETTIPGLNYEGGNIIDFDKLSDRYDALREYMNTSITDTVEVQHIVEYIIEGTTEGVVYTDNYVEYPGGGYYRWDVDVTGDDGTYIGGLSDLKSVNDGLLNWRFGVAGYYTFTRNSVHRTATVSALTYSCNEYWILADTGQIIYKQVSNGRLNNSTDAGNRSNDRNVAYYDAVINTAEESTTYSDYVTAAMLEEGLATSELGLSNYTTMRIQ